MSDDFKCPICGKPTSNYYGRYREDGLCREHKDMLKDGLIYQCEDCGKWNEKDVVCECKKIKKVKPENELTCIICGEPSNGKHFCINCWKLYQNKTIYLKIVNCKNYVPLGSEYEGHLETIDGHIVKSHVERDIDNYLFRNNIPHAYESTYDVDGNPEHEFRPDFYLPNYLGEGKDVYMEYFGMKGTKDGDKKINYKMPIYKRDNATVICLYPQDDSRIESVLKRKLNKKNIEEGKINEK